MNTVLMFLVVNFFVGLVLRQRFKGLCAICFSVSASWAVLLVSRKFFLVDPIIISLLIGGSAVGSMYYLSSKLSANWSAFKVPYLFTAFALSYYIVSGIWNWQTLLLLALVWALFLGISFNGRWKHLAKKIIECCKNW